MAKISSYGNVTPAINDKVVGTDVSNTTNDAGGETNNFLLSAIADLFRTRTETLTNKTLTSPAINVASDATGDIYYRTAGGAFARLAVGSTDDVLTVASGLPSWAAGGGGTVSVVSFGTLASAATLELTLDETLYDRFELCLYNCIPAADGDLRARVSIDGGATFISSASAYETLLRGYVDSTAVSSFAASTSIEISNEAYNLDTVNNGLTAVLDIMHPHGGGEFVISGLTWTRDYSNRHVSHRTIGTTNADRDVDAIQLYFSSGNIASGKYVLYGYAKGV